MAEHKYSESNNNNTNKKALYITGIPKDWKVNDLLNYFAEFQPQSAHIIRNRPVGFVNFVSNKDAYCAMKHFNKFNFLYIQFSRSQSPEQKRDKLWKETTNAYGRKLRQRDLTKLQNLIIEYPNNAIYHYEYACAIQSKLDKETKRFSNPNLVELWLKHINIAINLSNKPPLIWIRTKIQFLMCIYDTNNNCYNIDIDEVLNFTWNAVTNYDKYFFYIFYLRLLCSTQREHLVTKSLQLFTQCWNGKEKKMYFKQYKDYAYFIICMTQNGCKLSDIIDIVNEIWIEYCNEYNNGNINIDENTHIEFNKQVPIQKNATFGMYCIMLRLIQHIDKEYQWKINNNIIINKCINWLLNLMIMRPHYMHIYIELSFIYFWVMNDYVKARNVLDIGINSNCQQLLYDDIIKIINERKVNGYGSAKKWDMFNKWIQNKILNDKELIEDLGERLKTPMIGDGGIIQPGSKFNISFV